MLHKYSLARELVVVLLVFPRKLSIAFLLSRYLTVTPEFLDSLVSGIFGKLYVVWNYDPGLFVESKVMLLAITEGCG